MATVSGNPAVKLLTNAIRGQEEGPTATIAGSVNKVFIMLGLTVLTATFTWAMFFKAVNANGGTLAPAGWAAGQTAVVPYMIGGIIGGLICGIAIWLKPRSAPISAPLYALFEGLFLGGISALFHAIFNKYPIVIQAIGLTFGTLAALLICYKTGVIRVTEKFRAGVYAAVGAVMMLYLVTLVLSLFNVSVPFLHQAGPIGIGISVVIVIIAAMNLVVSFDNIVQAQVQELPKVYEWVAAFSLMAALIWLYMEILRLLAIIAASRD